MPTWGEILEELRQIRERQGKVSGVGSPFDIVRRKYVKALAKHTGRNVIVYASRWTDGRGDPDSTSITPEDVQGFMEVIHGLPSDGIDLVLHSPGGSPEATESVVKYLRSKFSDVRVLVPHAAMSAATMLACSANRIVMGRHSFLGPIDPQMIVHTELGTRAVAAHAILEQFRRAQEECRDPSRLPSWLPILRQFGPALLIQSQNAIDLSEALVSDWLTRYMFAGESGAKVKAAKIAASLNSHGAFKSHGRFLSRDELRGEKFGLLIDDLEDDQKLQDGLLSVFHAFTHTFSATPAVKIIENHMGKAFIKSAQIVPVPTGPTVLPAGLVPVPLNPPPFSS